MIKKYKTGHMSDVELTKSTIGYSVKKNGDHVGVIFRNTIDNIFVLRTNWGETEENKTLKGLMEIALKEIL